MTFHDSLLSVLLSSSELLLFPIQFSVSTFLCYAVDFSSKALKNFSNFSSQCSIANFCIRSCCILWNCCICCCREICCCIIWNTNKCPTESTLSFLHQKTSCNLVHGLQNSTSLQLVEFLSWLTYQPSSSWKFYWWKYLLGYGRA